MLGMSLDGELAALGSLLQQIPNATLSTLHESRRTEETIESLNAILGRIGTDFASDESVFKQNEALQQRLSILINHSVVTITKLKDTLEQSPSTEAEAPSDVDQLQHELSVRYSDLADFVDEALGKEADEMARRDAEANGSHDQETLILEAVDKILTDGSMPKETSPTTSEQRRESNAAWKHLLMKLKLSGFQSADVERHKTSIFHKLSESLHLHHHSTSSGATTQSQAVLRPRVVIPAASERGHAPVQSPVMSYVEHLKRGSTNSSKYKRPTASTIADDSDDDAESVGSDASTLLGPIDDRLPSEHYTFASPAASSPINRNVTPNTGPRSPLVQDEKIVASSPREVPPRTLPTSGYFVQARSVPRNGGPIARPNSPRERNPRYNQQSYPAPRRPGSPRNVSITPIETSVGRRTRINPNWHYRRSGDMYAITEHQSMDVQDHSLPEAAAAGRPDLVEWMLQNGFNIESFGSRSENQNRDYYRTTALFRAAIEGHFAIVQLLLRHRANPNPYRSDGKSLVRLLAGRGAVEVLRLLLEYGADPQNQGALPQAALVGHYNVVQLLLDYNANINEVSKQTALYQAASRGHRQIVELLLREGADTELTNSDHSALYKAVQHGHFPCVRSLLQYGARWHMSVGPYAETILHVASAVGDEAIVTELLRRGAPPNEANGYGSRAPIEGRRRYPLHFAVKGGHLGTTQALLDYDADPNVLTEDGRGPVDVAIEYGHMQLRDLLTRAGGYPQQSVYDRGPGYRVQDMDSPRGSYDSQVRRFSSSVPERPRYERRPSGLQAVRSFENDPRRRDRSANGTRRSEKDSQRPSTASKTGAAAAMGFLGSAALMMIGG